MPFPALPDKRRYPSCLPACEFLDALRAHGREPPRSRQRGVPMSASSCTYPASEAYASNYMRGTGPGRIFLVNTADGRVGVTCLGIGAPAWSAREMEAAGVFVLGHVGDCLSASRWSATECPTSQWPSCRPLPTPPLARLPSRGAKGGRSS